MTNTKKISSCSNCKRKIITIIVPKKVSVLCDECGIATQKIFNEIIHGYSDFTLEECK